MTKEWPTQGDEIDLESDVVYPMGWGLIFRVVCAPERFDDDAISDIVSRNDPPGTSVNRWVVCPDERAEEHEQWVEQTGVKTARAPCPDDPGRCHVLMNC